MEVIRVREKIYQQFKSPSVALGNFDGVHLGHREIIRRTVSTAHSRGFEAVVYTFDPHPRAVLNKQPEVPKITSIGEREDILRNLGVDVVILAEFTPQFALQSPLEFVDNILVEELGVAHVFIGENYRFGRNRAGTPQTLKDLGPAKGFAVHVVPPVLVGGAVVSSSRIRDHLAKGEIARANELLGRQFTISGEVVHGHRRGKQLGFPTANIRPVPKLRPPQGVYAVMCELDGALFKAVMNIGHNPTFMDTQVSYEVHILDFDRDIYGAILKVYLVDRLRQEKRFENVEALKMQIGRDVELARDLLTGVSAGS